MPINDWDGTTTYHNHKKAVDWDGTTSNILGKGWDWDGTTSNLFYSAEKVVFENGQLATEYSDLSTKGWKGGSSDQPKIENNLFTVWTNGGEQSTVCYTAIDVTDYNKLIFTTDSTSGSGAGGLISDLDDYGYSAFDVKTNITAGASCTIDISGLTGLYYLKFRYRNTYLRFSKIHFE